MEKYGLKGELTQRIMNPDFKTIRLMESAAFWTIDTLIIKYGVIETAQERSRLRENRRNQRGDTTSHHSGSRNSTSATSSAAHTSAQADAEARRHRNALGCTILWRGYDGRRTTPIKEEQIGEIDL